MKAILFFFIACLCLQSLNAQKIKLNKDDEFTYRGLSYRLNHTLKDDGSITNSKEIINKAQVHFKVIEVLKESYRLIAQFNSISQYNRNKDIYDEQWQTGINYNVELKDSNSIVPIPEYQIEFLLSHEGAFIEGNILQSSLNDRNKAQNIPDSLKIKWMKSMVSELFQQFSSRLKKGELIIINEDTLKVYNVLNENVILHSTGNDKKIQTEKIYDLHTGMLLERNMFHDFKRIKSSYDFPTKDDITDTIRLNYDFLSLDRLKLIKTERKPYSCIFRINDKDRDTTFLKTNVTVKGKIIHPNQNREVSIEWDEISPNNYKRYSIVTQLDKENVFEIRLSIDDFKKVTLRHGEVANFYLTPGDNLFITLDTDAFDETITASGIGSKNLNHSFKRFLFEESEKISQQEIYNQASEKYVELTPNEFKKYFLAILDKKQKYLNENNKWIDPELYLAEYWGNQTTIVSLLQNYPHSQEYFRIQAKKENFNIDRKEFFDSEFYTLIHPDNAMMAYSDDYEYFLRGYVFFLLEDKMKEITGKGKLFSSNDDNYFVQLYNSRYDFSDFFFSGYNQYILKYQTVCDALRQANWDVFVELYNTFLKEYPNTYKAKILFEAYEKAKKVAPGKPAFDFELTDFEGNKVKLSDFRGKVVYIDFWSTTCGPCRSSIHWHSKKLQEAFEGTDVVLMYVALEDDVERPKQFMKEEGIKGIQLIAKGKEEWLIREKYFFNAIPHHYIIDKDGKIVQRQAPEPYLIVQNNSILLDALEPK